jgi:hypothetical protein
MDSTGDLFRRAPLGRTSDETECALGRAHQTISARYTDLRAEDYIMRLLDSAGNQVKRMTRQGSPADAHILTQRGWLAIKLGFVTFASKRDPTKGFARGNPTSATAFNNTRRVTDALEVLKDIARFS